MISLCADECVPGHHWARAFGDGGNRSSRGGQTVDAWD